MKLHLKTLIKILLPALLSGPASAQVTMILPGGANPYIGTPVNLPGPLGGATTGMKIEFPTPRLTPDLTVTLTPMPVAESAIIRVFPVFPIPRIPSRPIIPMIRPTASRENVTHPLAQILPGLRVQFAAVEKRNSTNTFEKMFDGRSVQISLPERDLEAEIGAY